MLSHQTSLLLQPGGRPGASDEAVDDDEELRSPLEGTDYAAVTKPDNAAAL